MMVIYLPVKFEFDWTNRFRVKSPETKMWTDRQTDIGHINLIGGLVTRNPPNKSKTSLIRDIQKKLDLHIGEPMQICIHRKDNSPKPVNHRLTLKEGPKVKSNNIRRFPAHDFL